MTAEFATPQLETSINWINEVPHVKGEYWRSRNRRELRVRNEKYQREFEYKVGQSTSHFSANESSEYTYVQVNLHSLRDNILTGLLMGYEERTYADGEKECILKTQAIGKKEREFEVMVYTQDGHGEFDYLPYLSREYEEWAQAGHVPFDELPTEIDFAATVDGLLKNARILCFRNDPPFVLPVTPEDSEIASTRPW